MSSHSDGMGCFYYMGFGLYLFYRSLKQHKLRRRIQDTGTSKIASAALGESVEIHGKVISDPDHLITSPLSGKPCVAFLWNLEKYTGAKKKNWVLQYRFFSTPFIYLTDESEAYAALDLSSCEFQENLHKKTFNFNDNSLELPEEVLSLLKENGMISGKKSFLFSEKYRLVEMIIAPRDSFFILGTAGPIPSGEYPLSLDHSLKIGKKNRNLKSRLKAAFETRKADPEFIQKYDKNGNLKMDEQEAEALYTDLEKTLLKKYQLTSLPESFLQKCKFIFTKASNGSFFSTDEVCVSSKTQRELTSTLALSTLFGLLAGPAVFILGVWLFINPNN